MDGIEAAAFARIEQVERQQRLDGTALLSRLVLDGGVVAQAADFQRLTAGQEHGPLAVVAMHLADPGAAKHGPQLASHGTSYRDQCVTRSTQYQAHPASRPIH